MTKTQRAVFRRICVVSLHIHIERASIYIHIYLYISPTWRFVGSIQVKSVAAFKFRFVTPVPVCSSGPQSCQRLGEDAFPSLEWQK